MIPFNVNRRGEVVGISLESLFWFFVVTAGATVVGEYLYQAYVVPRMTSLTADTNNLIAKL
jgi:hypothetical protein